MLDAIAEAYFNLLFAREDWIVRYQSLELAREQLRNTEKKIELGDLAPRDRIADQAEVAKKEEELITAEQAILKRIWVFHERGHGARRIATAFNEVGTLSPREARRTRRQRPASSQRPCSTMSPGRCASRP